MTLNLAEHSKEDRDRQLAEIRQSLGGRSIVLIGLMGAGKTAVGRRLANWLDLPFIDADSEIEEAAGQTIKEIFAEHGEAYFRDGERKVIARLLEGGPQVLATGGGAYMNPETRAAIKAHGVSIWLKADLRVLLKRVSRRDHRPLFAIGDPGDRDEEADGRARSRSMPKPTSPWRAATCPMMSSSARWPMRLPPSSAATPTLARRRRKAAQDRRRKKAQ